MPVNGLTMPPTVPETDPRCNTAQNGVLPLLSGLSGYCTAKTAKTQQDSASEFRIGENSPPQSTPIQSPWPCRRCESDRAIPGPGAGPHHAKITCADCGRFSRWLSPTQAQSLGLSVNGEAA
jgi:hypothetical protein